MEYLKYRNGNCFKCSYQHHGRKYVAKENSIPRNKQKQLKKLIRCPFQIGFNQKTSGEYRTKPSILRPVNVTNKATHYYHTCQMSSQGFRTAVQSMKSKVNVDVKVLHAAIHMLKINPQLPALELRPLLTNCVATNAPITASFLSNFRRRVALYILKNPNSQEITTKDGLLLVSQSKVTKLEEKVLQLPDVQVNYRKMYQGLMQSGEKTWKAIDMLKKLKNTHFSFEYRVHYNKNGLPDGIVWMTLHMRNMLLQYGDILFLDSQNRQFNKLGWPYIGPAIKTSNNKVGVTAESVVLVEDMNMYQWVLESMALMEPEWSLNKVRLIFADGAITDKLLKKLGIEDTCLLRGDYHHLMNEVWPSHYNFGVQYYPLIKKI